MTVHFVADLASVGVGYVLAVFTPAIASEVKSWFVSVAKVISSDVKTVEADVKKI